jgi:glutathione S-transferase
MKLYAHWSFSPQKVRFALEELGLGVDEVFVDLLQGEQKSPEFTAVNPMQKVPALEDDGFLLWESNAILAYLGEREERLWPKDVKQRADALRWMFFETRYLADAVGPLWFFECAAPSRGLPVGEKLPDGTLLAERIAKARLDLEHPLSVASDHFARHRWILGDEFSLADCSLGTTLAALASSRFDLTSYPGVVAYVDRVRERHAWETVDRLAPHPSGRHEALR